MFNPEQIAELTKAPRQSDELVFKTPWEARIFSIVAHLSDQEKFAWNEFRELLVEHIALTAPDAGTCDHNSGTVYYRAWLAAAEELLASRKMCTDAEIENRIKRLSDPHLPGKHSPTGNSISPIHAE